MVGMPVWDKVLAFGARFCQVMPTQESSEVTHLKDIQPALLVRVQDPGLAATEESAQHASLVHLRPGVRYQHGVSIPHPLC